MNRLSLFLLKTFVIMSSMLWLTACQTDPYAYRQTCLTRVLAQCKAHGWNYLQTNAACRRAAVEGIYGLSATQFRACRLADQATATFPKSVDKFVVKSY